MHASIRVLQVGPMYSSHIRRWSRLAKQIGCTVHAAGHLSPGKRRLDLSGLAETVDIAPEPLSESDTESHVPWLRSVIDRLQPDVVHAHYLSRWPYVASLAESRPLVVTPWGSDIYLASGSARRRADHALRHADAVIARSPHMRRELLARGVPVERIYSADLGVDLEQFSPAPELANVGRPVILSFRAGTALYNLDLVLDAFRVVRGRIPDATLVLVHGEARLDERAQARLDEVGGDGVTRIAGSVSHTDMADYMRAATIGVSVPRSDGSPNSVWEALATGLPLVLSRLPQLEERLGPDAGAVFVEQQPGAIARGVIALLEDPTRRRRMATAGRAWAESNMDEREQRARLRAVYAAACKSR